MMYRFIFDDQFFRTIPGIMIDSRKGTPLANKIGSVIKQFIDRALSAIGPNTLPYKIETGTGSVAGIFTLQLDNTGKIATLDQFVLRPAFQEDISTISAQIGNFIQTNGFVPDFLN